MPDRTDHSGRFPLPHRSSISTSEARVATARMPVADHPSSPRPAPGSHPPEPGRPPLDELMRLRKRVDQQEHSLAAMAQAIAMLRDGNRALRDENRDLRLELQATTPRSGATVGSTLPARNSEHEPTAPRPPERELHRRADIVRRELRALRPQARS